MSSVQPARCRQWDQPSQHINFSEAEFAAKKQPTRRKCLPADLERVLPWQEVLELIETHYLKAKRSRPLIGMERMPRGNRVHLGYGRSDVRVDDAIADSQALRCLVRIAPVAASGAGCHRAVAVSSRAGRERTGDEATVRGDPDATAGEVTDDARGNDRRRGAQSSGPFPTLAPEMQSREK